MSIRVGHILKHKDVHGVSGTGRVADVFEATNGKCIVVWISPHSSVNVFDHIKDVESTHSHGGKTLVVWDYESAPDPDPMDALKDGDAEKPTLTDDELAEISTEAVEVAQKKVGEMIAQKLSEAPDRDEVLKDKK